MRKLLADGAYTITGPSVLVRGSAKGYFHSSSRAMR